MHDKGCCIVGDQQQLNKLEEIVPKMYVQQLVQERCTEEMATVVVEMGAAIDTLTRQQNRIDSTMQVGNRHSHQHAHYWITACLMQ